MGLLQRHDRTADGPLKSRCSRLPAPAPPPPTHTHVHIYTNTHVQRCQLTCHRVHAWVPRPPACRLVAVLQDVASGIQDFLICIEMFLAALAHAYAFPPRVGGWVRGWGPGSRGASGGAGLGGHGWVDGCADGALARGQPLAQHYACTLLVLASQLCWVPANPAPKALHDARLIPKPPTLNPRP